MVGPNLNGVPAQAAAHTQPSLQSYYAQRAAEYERIYAKPERQADLRALEAWVAQAFAGERVLEVACGTGWWTPHGARHCAQWLATDINAETLALARQKPLPAQRVQFALLDAYALSEGLQRLGLDAAADAAAAPPFSAAFAGFWWSHVPLARLGPWLDNLHRCLAPGARVVILDNRFVAGSSTPIARRDTAGNQYQTRRLDDGSEYEVLKNFPKREDALALLAARARPDPAPQWLEFGHYWLLDYRVA